MKSSRDLRTLQGNYVERSVEDLQVDKYSQTLESQSGSDNLPGKAE